MDAPDGLYPNYVAVWRPILLGWLGWTQTRFDAWVSAWDFLIRNVECHRVWFYHEPPLYYVLPLLVPEDLAGRLASQRTGRMYSDLAELEHEGVPPRAAGN